MKDTRWAAGRVVFKEIGDEMEKKPRGGKRKQ